MTSACILKPVCEYQAPEHHEPVTGKYSGSDFTAVDYTLRVIQPHYNIIVCVHYDRGATEGFRKQSGL